MTKLIIAWLKTSHKKACQVFWEWDPEPKKVRKIIAMSKLHPFSGQNALDLVRKQGDHLLEDLKEERKNQTLQGRIDCKVEVRKSNLPYYIPVEDFEDRMKIFTILDEGWWPQQEVWETQKLKGP